VLSDGHPQDGHGEPARGAVAACLAVADASGMRLGVLRVSDSAPRAWSERDLSQLTALAEEAGLSAPASDRSPSYLDVDPGPPLGVVATPYAEQRVELAPRATLVLFNDGLVKRRDESITDGLERLRRAVVEPRMPPEAVADHVLEQCGLSAGRGDDDIALLVLHHA